MTATIIPIHRISEGSVTNTNDLPDGVVTAFHALWEALETVPPEQTANCKWWMERVWGINPSVLDEVRAAKETREAAIRDCDNVNHPDPA